MRWFATAILVLSLPLSTMGQKLSSTNLTYEVGVDSLSKVQKSSVDSLSSLKGRILEGKKTSQEFSQNLNDTVSTVSSAIRAPLDSVNKVFSRVEYVMDSASQLLRPTLNQIQPAENFPDPLPSNVIPAVPGSEHFSNVPKIDGITDIQMPELGSNQNVPAIGLGEIEETVALDRLPSIPEIPDAPGEMIAEKIEGQAESSLKDIVEPEILHAKDLTSVTGSNLPEGVDLNAIKDPTLYREQIIKKGRAMVAEQVLAKEAPIVQSVERLSKHQRRMETVFSKVKGLPKRNDVKDQDRLIAIEPSITLQVLRLTDWAIDFNPAIACRLKKPIRVLVGWNERIGISDYSFSKRTLYGVRFATEANVISSYWFTVSAERMSSRVVDSNLPVVEGNKIDHLWFVSVGVKSELALVGRVKSNLQFLYNVIEESNSVYPNRFNLRVGFSFARNRERK